MEAFCSGVNKVSRWGSRSFLPSCRPLTLTSRQSALHLGSLFVWFTSSQIHLKAIVLLWRIPWLPLLPHSRLETAHTHIFTQTPLTYLSLSHPLAQSLNAYTHSAHLSWSNAEGDCYPGNRINPQISRSGCVLRRETEGEHERKTMRRRLRNKVKENQYVIHLFSFIFPFISIIVCLCPHSKDEKLAKCLLPLVVQWKIVYQQGVCKCIRTHLRLIKCV